MKISLVGGLPLSLTRTAMLKLLCPSIVGCAPCKGIGIRCFNDLVKNRLIPEEFEGNWTQFCGIGDVGFGEVFRSGVAERGKGLVR